MTLPREIREATEVQPECIRLGRRRGEISRKVRAQVYAEHGEYCAICGRREGDDSEPVLLRGGPRAYPVFYERIHKVWLTLDHKIPIAKGGCNHAHNLIPMCNQCNSRKGGQ